MILLLRIAAGTPNYAFVPDPQCGGCQGWVTAQSVAPCLKNTTYCEGYTAVSHIPEELAETLNKSLKCKWNDVLEAARRTFDRAAKTLDAAHRTYQKAKEAWRHAQDTLDNIFYPRKAWESAKKAWEAAKEAWSWAQKAWKFALETAKAAKDFCVRAWDLLEDVYDKFTGWFSRCIT